MTEALAVFAVGIVVTLVLVGAAWWWARTMRSKMQAQDAELRPMETETGKCAACDGSGTRIETFAGRSVSQDVVTCYRCGGSGSPPKAGPLLLAPSPLGFRLRAVREQLRRRSQAR